MAVCIVLRRGTSTLGPAAASATASAGALAGAAALELTCRGASALPHAVTFHVAGVAVAAVVRAIVVRVTGRARQVVV